MRANGIRITAGREHLSEEVVRVAEDTLANDLTLHVRSPGSSTTRAHGNLVPLGFLGSALKVIGDAGGQHADAARRTHKEILEKLEAARNSGLWGYTTGCMPTSTDTALVALAGVSPDFEALESRRGPRQGFTDPERTGDDARGIETQSAYATEHWVNEDVPTTALLEAMRVDAGLPTRIDASWYLSRYKYWGGLYFTNPALSAWTIARIAMRLAPEGETDVTDSEMEQEEDETAKDLLKTHERLCSLVKLFMWSLCNQDGSFGRFDPILTNSFAVLALGELGIRDQSIASAQIHILDAWEQNTGVETPFHATLRLPKASSKEEIAAQLLQPSTRMLDDAVHQVTTYEDPNRLIMVAAACLALHVETDSSINEPELFPVVHVHPAEPVQQALKNVAAYCKKTAPIGSGISTPFSYPAARANLTEATKSLLQVMGPELVSDAAYERVLQATNNTNEDHVGAATFGLEVRLHEGDDQIDFLWHASRGSSNLAALLNCPDPNSSMAHLAALWKLDPEDNKPPIAYIDNIWFEYDLNQDVDLPPGFFFGPSKLKRQEVPSYGPLQVRQNVEKVVHALKLPPELLGSLSRSMEHLETMDTQEPVFQTGLMFSRPDSPIRLCFSPREYAETTPLDLVENQDTRMRSAKLRQLTENHGVHTAICLDIGPDGISPRVGLEFHQGKEHEEMTRIEHLQALASTLLHEGIGDPARTKAFLACEGWNEIDENGGCNRIINHIKCVIKPGAPIELKGYIGLNRSQRPHVHSRP